MEQNEKQKFSEEMQRDLRDIRDRIDKFCNMYDVIINIETYYNASKTIETFSQCIDTKIEIEL